MKEDAIRIGCLLLSALAAGCLDEDEPVNSLDVSTKDMTVSVDAEDMGGGATVKVDIWSPLGSMWLSGGDTLLVEMAGAPLDMRQVEDNGNPIYQADVPELLGDLSLTIKRPSDLSVDHVPVPVPLPPKLFAEPIVGNFPLVLTWDEALDKDHTASLVIEGDCIQTIQRNLAKDTGSYAVQQAEFFPKDESNPSACPLHVTMTRNAMNDTELVPGSYGLNSWITVARAIVVSWTK